MIWLIAGAVLVVLGVLAREFWFGLFLPVVAQNLAGAGKHDRALRLFERLLTVPLLMAGPVRQDLRYRLAWLYLEAHRYEEAVGLLRTNLKRVGRPADQEAADRFRMAECLEAGGNKEEADAERKRAKQLLATAPLTPAVRLRRAEGLKNERRYGEALVEYEAFLATAKPNQPELHSVLLRASLCAFEAGNPALALTRAEAAVEKGGTRQEQRQAHKIAALASSASRNLKSAERHVRASLELAREEGNKEAEAALVGQLASFRMRRGDLVEASQLVAEAAGLSLDARRGARLTEAEILRLWGRWDAARTALFQARNSGALAGPQYERRSQATLALAQAGLEAEAGSPKLAWTYLEECREEMERDDKLRYWWNAHAAWIHALLGRREEADRCLGTALNGAAHLATDPGTQEFVRSLAARTLLLLDRPAEARREAEAYLATNPELPFRVFAHYLMGECLVELGEREAAIREFAAALHLGLEVHFTGRARKRLAELTTPASSASSAPEELT